MRRPRPSYRYDQIVGVFVCLDQGEGRKDVCGAQLLLVPLVYGVMMA